MEPGVCSERGSRGSGPASTDRVRATSATVRAIGPFTDNWPQGALSGQDGTRPGDGRSPTTLLKEAGLRSEPPVSLPSAMGCIPQARAAPAPPLLPPALRERSYGLRVAPKTGLTVCEPRPSSGTLVLPRVMAPAFRSRSTTRWSRPGTRSAKIGEPDVVRMPAVSCRSLCATGSPCSGPTGSPAAIRSSASDACSSAWSATSVTIAFTAGLTRSIRSRWAVTTSRAEISRRASATESS